MSTRRSLVAANWKMNGTLSSIRPLLADVCKGMAMGVTAEVVICPPCVYLGEVARLLEQTGLALGAQNLSRHDAGAYTGEVAAAMLKDYQCRYVIIGHSERRTLYGENDALVADKFIQASRNGLIPILCIGEYLEEREAGETENVLSRQLDAVIGKAGIAAFDQAVIAYEPVWAIGTGKTATPSQAEEAHAFIRLQLARHDDKIANQIRILYGGSVKAANAKELFNMANIDGGLIGGASLQADEFLDICRAA
jgi:triosephosphate isomerase